MKNSHATVYIVDDDMDVRRTLQCLLESDARRVIAYPSAEALLADFESAHPCCLILDLQLAGLTGQALLEELRANYATLPVVIITGHVDVSTALRAMRLGAVDVCQKPVDPEVLLPLIEQTLAADAASERQRQQIAAARERLARLTARERELFKLVVEGQSYKEMASSLGISPRTVEHHRANITTKLGMDRVADLVRLGLIAGEGTLVPAMGYGI